MTTTDTTPPYNTIPWLFARWPTETLIQWRDSEIEARAVQVAQMEAENQALYAAAKIQRAATRDSFRVQYPRRDLPGVLKRAVPYPPDLAGTWKKLIARREARLRQMSWAAEEKRAAFREKMEEGQFKAMQQREKAIRQTINALARDHGLRLSERVLDKRLEELLIAVGLLESEEVSV